ncbi:MAG: hypothetical protein LBS50_11655 [Prevotellaceae bacterium]|jgi:hypothetical protein|nr:hypothetical protein [Prevotellaceae bacterium]
METKIEKWDSIKKRYPDSFLLIENPDYDGALLKSGIVRYKHKSREKVYDKAAELALNDTTILYSGGIRRDRLKNVIFIL